MIGKTISHYKILEKLGEGGMGVVYKAEDMKLRREVAIKFLPHQIAAHAEERKRFEHEAQAAAALNHPNIATIYAIEEADNETFIVMEYIKGQTLQEIISANLPKVLNLRKVLDYAIQIVEGLQVAHKKDIVHRDIKSSNIMITETGQVKIMDFGLAKLAGRTKLTKTSTTLGTTAYMSPEQARGEVVDHLTDIWSLGVVLYELLTGELPFKGDYEQAVIYSIFNEEPMPLDRDVPEELQNVILRALEKDREKRFESADELLQQFKKLRGADIVPETKVINLKVLMSLLKQPKYAIATLSLFLILALAVFVPYQQRVKLQRAKALLPKIENLAQAGKYAESYDLAVQAEKRLKSDSTLMRLLPIISDKLTVVSEPESARVFLKRFAPDEQGNFPDKEYVGITPITDTRIARGSYKVYLQKEGYVPVERIASSELNRAYVFIGGSPDVKLEVKLIESDKAPENMVFVPGGDYKLVSYDTPTTDQVHLDDYFIDRYEVSLKEYKEFVDAGGYLKKTYWKHPFIKDSKQLSWEEAIKHFTDRTGLPGPHNWVNQEYPEGKQNHPVTHITWYEAAAYAEFVGKSLPTIFQWEKASRDRRLTHFSGVVMPWGFVRPKERIEHRANFNGKDTKPVDSYEFGISPYGCYNMVGNVKELCLNEIDGGYATTGGSWKDPNYVAYRYGVFPGFYASSSLGFRCVRNSAEATGDQGAMRIDLERRTPSYSPVDETSFKNFLSHYKYDKKPLNAQIIETIETVHWTREKVTIEGIRGDRIIAYLYLPKRATKPFQCINFVAGDDVFYARTTSEHTEWLLAPQMKSGRAVLAVVWWGALEREELGSDVLWRREINTVRYREGMVRSATEFSIGLDYLATRDDIDIDKLAFLGLSGGAHRGVIFPSVENRYRSVIFIGGGLTERDQQRLPEVNPINFVPHIKPPKLVLSGKHDEVLPVNTCVVPLYNLLSKPKQLTLTEGGHIPPLEERVPVINKWLDETLGPVKFE
ncbi:MAG: protein kinase [bacterium]